MASDEEDGDDDEGEEGEEGELNEEGGVNESHGDDVITETTEQQTPDVGQDQEMGDGDGPTEVVRPSSIEEPREDSRPAEADTEIINTQQQPSSSLNLGATHLGVPQPFPPRQHEGSPLKNVVLPSPTEPKDLDFPNISAVQEATSGTSEVQPITEGTSQITETVQQQSETTAAGLAVVETSEQTTPAQATTSLTPEAPPTDAPGDSAEALSVVKEVNASATLEATHDSSGDQQATTSVHTPSSQQSHQASSTHSLLPSLREPPNEQTPSPLQPPVLDRPAAEEESMDLLGGLERELDRQSGTSIMPAEGAAGDQP